jgi:hypothetical protein
MLRDDAASRALFTAIQSRGLVSEAQAHHGIAVAA